MTGIGVKTWCNRCLLRLCYNMVRWEESLIGASVIIICVVDCGQKTRRHPCGSVVVLVKWGSLDEYKTSKEFSKFNDLEIEKQ